MKHTIDWKRLGLFVAITGGLLFVTGSFAMSLGIILLLFVADHFIAEWEAKRKKDKDR